MAFALSACTGLGPATIGGRPLVYKQGPGDNPETIEAKGGEAYKRPDAAPAKPAPAPAPKAAPAPSTPAPAAPPPAPIAQAAAPAPRAAPVAGDAFNRYTQATRYGDLLFVSGQIALDPRTGDFDTNQSVEAQTRRALENVRAVLEANRLTMANVVSVTVYLSSISRLSVMDSVYHDFFKGTPPARTVVEVSNLPRGAQVEISVIAGR